MTGTSVEHLRIRLSDMPHRPNDMAGAGAAAMRRVVAGRMARADRIRAAGMIAGADRSLTTMNDLFVTAAEALEPRLRPAQASHRLVRHEALYELLSDEGADLCAQLRGCRQRNADREVLLAWIDRVSARADRDHADAAATPVEVGVEYLRTQLAERGLHSETQRRAIIARAAARIRLGYGLIVEPQDFSEPFTSGLIKGLAANQSVTVLGYSNEYLADVWLAQARLEPDRGAPAAQTAWSNDGPAGALFGPAARDGAMAWCEAPDQHEEAIAQVAALIGRGVEPSQITLVLARPERELFAFEQRAARAGVPVLARLPIRWQHTALGRFAYLACTPGVSAGELCIPGRHLGFDAAQLERILAVRGLDRVGVLAELLEERAGRPGVPDEVLAREFAWLDALAGEVEAAGALPRSPRSRDIIEGAASGSVMLGDLDGVAVVGFAEAQALRRTHLIATGLSDGEWPPTDHPSPFISAQTLVRCPGLASPDRRVGFVAACAAHQEVLLLREGLDGAGRRRARSVLLAAADSAGARTFEPIAPPVAATTARRHAPAARFADTLEGVLSPGASGRGSASARTDAAVRALAPGAYAQKDRFSVSELSQYLSCPLGWAVRYGLGIRTPQTAKQEIGQTNHLMLQAAFTPAEASVAERIELARDAARDAGLGKVDVATNLMHVQRVIETYSPPAWPGRPVMVEYDCVRTFGKPETTIVGRIDRIDELRNGRLLLIDYKRGQRAYELFGDRLTRDVQAIAYPHMVARELDRDVAGILFVSITDPSHNGLLTGRFPGIDAEHVHIEWHLYEELAREQVLEAIRGIRAGEITERGPGCWDRCPCRGLRDLGAM